MGCVSSVKELPPSYLDYVLKPNWLGKCRVFEWFPRLIRNDFIGNRSFDTACLAKFPLSCHFVCKIMDDADGCIAVWHTEPHQKKVTLKSGDRNIRSPHDDPAGRIDPASINPKRFAGSAFYDSARRPDHGAAPRVVPAFFAVAFAGET